MIKELCEQDGLKKMSVSNEYFINSLSGVGSFLGRKLFVYLEIKTNDKELMEVYGVP